MIILLLLEGLSDFVKVTKLVRELTLFLPNVQSHEDGVLSLLFLVYSLILNEYVFLHISFFFLSRYLPLGSTDVLWMT